jgi:hypothetical protein
VIEVLLVGNRWTWRLLCPRGRVLVYTDETFPTNDAANDAAKIYRSGFWLVSDRVDHRMARCI